MKMLFELELTRNDVTPAQFLAYVRRMCKQHDIPFEMSARDFAAGQHWGSDEYMNTRYVGGTPSTRPCVSEICKATPYDHQTYIHNFDGSVYNEIIEFTFDDEKTGHGYFFTIQTETDDEHRGEDTHKTMESIANYHRNQIASCERAIEKKRRDLAEIERNIENGWAGDHAHYWAESLRFEIGRLERESAEHAAAVKEAEAEIEKIIIAAISEAESTVKRTPELDKVLTYAELIALAKKHYNEGGDGIVECWSEKDFDEYVEEFGPVTLRIAFDIMELHDEDIKAEIVSLFGNTEEQTQPQTMYKVVMVSMGGTRQDMFTGLTYENAQKICEDYGWEVAPDGGYVWDLEIEEDDST